MTRASKINFSSEAAIEPPRVVAHPRIRENLSGRAPSSPGPAGSRDAGDGRGFAGACFDKRPTVEGKFIFTGPEKLLIRGVTYGPFCPEPENTMYAGSEYHTPEVAAADFSQMAANGINAFRTYTPPPLWLLDLAGEHGLRVMIGLPWEQHIAFLDAARLARDIRRRVRDSVRACADHPAVLAFAVGNEIPAPIVRWYGHRRIERFLHQLYCEAKSQDSQALVTYVNYPTTEYLELPFVDFASFNVYLENPESLEAYVARLQNVAGDRPLLMTEMGFDSRGRGEEHQARTLTWQLETAMTGGCAGAFVFSWTDEWYRGGAEIENWGFGLTTRDRRPKPALTVVRKVFHGMQFPESRDWPDISVVVCTCNGARTLPETLQGLAGLDYPNYEVVVVNDGSTDATQSIVETHIANLLAPAEMSSDGFNPRSVRLINVPNGGLSSARNIGLAAARGEIVAYLDDDAWPDPHWLTYLASTFRTTAHAGVGGPNLPPPDDAPVARCVACSPGGPTHVLLTDTEAEHIPGCNMAFRKECLLAIGGFDPQFRIAGDDVDICWRLQQAGWKLGFNPAAVVWHRRRDTVRAYWKQQFNYGKAESDLERKWPEKYNAAGHLTWVGRLYGYSLLSLYGSLFWWGRRRIYHGTWGSALFQSVHHAPPSVLESVPMMPEWHLMTGTLVVLAAMAVAWHPLRWAWLVLPLSLVPPLIATVRGALRAWHSSLSHRHPPPLRFMSFMTLTTWLHLTQPIVRLAGRLKCGLTPWRRRGGGGLAFPRRRVITIPRDKWQDSQQWLRRAEGLMRDDAAMVIRGGDYDRWDLQVRAGLFGRARLFTMIEEHGHGKQFARFRIAPRVSRLGISSVLLFAILALLSSAVQLQAQTIACTLAALALVVWIVYDCSAATSAVLRAVQTMGREGEEPQVQRTLADQDEPTDTLDEFCASAP